jgi:zinc protease
MTREALIERFTGYFGPQNATLVAVGDIKRDDLMSKVAHYLGDWTAETASGPAAPDDPGEAPATTTVYLVDRPGAPQSVIRAAQKTITRLDPDYYSLFLVNYLFGGHATARLFMNLRQDKGYSYGYYSQIDWLTGPSALSAGGSVQTEVTKEALIETLKEFADIRGGRPITQDEYDKAKKSIFRGFPSQFESQGQVLQQLSSVIMYGLPDDYYSKVMARLDRVTLDDARAVASSRIDDGRLVVLIVGDREAIEPGLKELGLPIVAVDSEGRPT